MALDAPMPGATKRTGFMAGQFTVPDDFDCMGDEDIEAMFGGDA